VSKQFIINLITKAINLQSLLFFNFLQLNLLINELICFVYKEYDLYFYHTMLIRLVIKMIEIYLYNLLILIKLLTNQFF